MTREFQIMGGFTPKSPVKLAGTPFADGSFDVVVSLIQLNPGSY